MIDYVEIRNSARVTIGIIDTAKSIIWDAQYYGIGAFEIYVPATAETRELLKIGYYVTRENERNVGIIERISIDYTSTDGQMITASGSFAKSLLSRRLIYNLSGNTIYPVTSSGNVETAMRARVAENIINSADSARNIDFLELGAAAGINKRIVDADGNYTVKQTSYANLQEYTDTVLQEFALGAFVGLDRETLKLQYNVFSGVDRSATNPDGNAPIIFSQEFDNLLSSAYDYDTATEKNTVLIGGEGEGTARFCVLLADAAQTGLNRREVFLNASGQSRKYSDENGAEQEYTNTEYTALLKSLGEQTRATLKPIETFSGEIDLTNSGLQFGADYQLGDIITIQDNFLGILLNVRILQVLESQDDSGNRINISFGG